MSSGFTLDTNILTAILREESLAVQAEYTPGISTTVVAAGELLYDAYKKGAPTLTARIVRLLSVIPVVTFTPRTHEIWAQNKATLAREGITIPDNDLWIATVALELNLTVVTRDKHFGYVSGLTVVRW